MILIRTFKELEDWLEDYNYFEEGHILKIDRDPLVITLGILISGSFKANTQKEILSFKITPKNVFSFDYPNDFEPSDDHYIESIEPLEAYKGIGLQFIGPPTFKLIAESFKISERETIQSIFKPWISQNEISIQVSLVEIPKPNFWIQKFKEFGYEVVFRCYGGESTPLEKVCYPDYSGFFFQLKKRVSTTITGIFIQNCSIQNHEVSMSFRCDDDLSSLWTALTTILANIPGVKILCGNCEFTGEEWKRNF